jgi:hypothetical protein
LVLTILSNTGGESIASASRRDIVLLQVIVAYFVVLRLAYALFVPPNGDEAYYWLWGGHLQLSYYDHSPMVGWTSAIGRALLGWTPAGLHLPALVTFLVLAIIIHRAAGWIAPEDPRRYFWLCLAIFSASPLYNALTTLNYPDHILICFTSGSLLFFGRYLNDALTRTERQSDLYLGALFLGLAGLSKYSAVFVPAGMVVALIALPRLRRLFGSVHLYAAGALTFAITLPVWVWNAQHRFASLEWHAVERLNGAAPAFTPFYLVRTIVFSILMLSPFLIAGLARFLVGRPPDPRQVGLMMLGRGTAWISTIVLLPLAAWGGFGRQVSPHWLVLSFLPFLLIAPLYLRSRWIIGLHLTWGILFNTLAVVYYLSAPLATDILGIEDAEAVRTFGQDQFAAEVTRIADEYGAIAIVHPSYPLLARLTFGLGDDSRVSDLGRRVDLLTGRQFGANDAGKDMVLVGGHGAVASRFESIEELPGIQVERFGRVIETYEVAIGHGFKP